MNSPGIKVLSSSLLRDVLDPLLDRGMRAGLGNFGDAGGKGVQIDEYESFSQPLFF